MLKKENGVTLVALVITIIVLLILAGVTLAMVMGDSGIFTKANKASKETRISSARDAVRLAVLEVTTDQYSDTGDIDTTKVPADSAAAIKLINDQLKDGYQIEDGKIKQNGTPVTGANDKDPITVTITVNATNHSISAEFGNDTVSTDDSSDT